MLRSPVARFTTPLALLAFAAAVPLAASAHDRKHKADLDGFEEVPAVSTLASGKFKLRYEKNPASINWELQYEDVNPTQAHIHFAQKGVNGGIMVFLCTNLSNGPAGTQACPSGPALISGTIVAADVGAGAAGQGIPAGSFAKLVEAIEEGVAYANVHSATFPGGEIRGQIR